MVRYPRGSAYCEHRRPTRFVHWSPYQTLEVAGEWAPTMKAAKASYKEALRQRMIIERAEKKRLAA